MEYRSIAEAAEKRWIAGRRVQPPRPGDLLSGPKRPEGIRTIPCEAEKPARPRGRGTDAARGTSC